MKLVSPTDQALWTPCEKVTDIAIQVMPFLPEMRSILTETNGRGLAAPQVGLKWRFFITTDGVYINPEWVYNSEKSWTGTGLTSALTSSVESCLSFPGRKAVIDRWRNITAKWFDLEDEVNIGSMWDSQAILFQHECDHLDGKCILPRP